MVAAARAIPEHTSSSLPAGCARWAGTTPTGVPLGFHLSSLTPYTLLHAQNRVPWKKASPWRCTLFSSVKQARLPPFPCQPSCFSEKMLGPRSTVKSKQCKLWSWAASNSSQKLNLGLLLGEQEKVNTRSTFLFSLLLWAEDTTAFFQPFAAGSSAILAIRTLKIPKTLGSPIALETDVQGSVFQKQPPHYF